MMPWALRQDLSLGVGEGQRLAPALAEDAAVALALSWLHAATERLDPVYVTLKGSGRFAA